MIRSIWNALLDVVFPANCLACETPLKEGERSVCPACWDSVPRVVEGEATINVLRRRLEERKISAEIYSPYYFEEEGTIQKIVHALKYDGFTQPGIDAGKRIGELMLRRCSTPAFDCIIPVPLHRSKRRERGYNQSDYIARGIADSLGIGDIETSILKRVHPTKTQTHLSVDERKKNVVGAFRVVRPSAVGGRHVLVVDDVITTGATVGECVAVLTKAGAKTVSIASMALARIGERGR